MANELSPARSFHTDSRSTPADPNNSVLQDGRTVLGDNGGGRNRVLIAEDATKDPSDICLIWALENVIRRGDFVTVLGILYHINTPMGYKSQANLSDFLGTNQTALGAEIKKKMIHFEEKFQPLAELCDSRGVYLNITITAGCPMKAVLVKEASKIKVTHVILDRNLRKDIMYYKEHLDCSVVAFSEKNQVEHVRHGSGLYIHDNSRRPSQSVKGETRATTMSTSGDFITLDLNNDRRIEGVPDFSSESESSRSISPSPTQHSRENSYHDLSMLNSLDGILPVFHVSGNGCSPAHAGSLDQGGSELETIYSSTKLLSPMGDAGHEILNMNASLSSALSISGSSHQIPSESSQKEGVISVHPRRQPRLLNELINLDSTEKGAESRPTDLHQSAPLEGEVAQLSVNVGTFASASQKIVSDSVVENADHEQHFLSHKWNNPVDGTVSFLGKNLAQPPPLCSVCKLKSPELGKSPKIYNWEELKAATNDFSAENLIVEGGFSFVYKGTLQEGQIVTIKKLKSSSLQGDVQFTAEVEAWSSAQHRNIVRLLGYCVENNERALVYEYVCNGSLDWHLSGHNGDVLEWSSRYKIAIGAARGLRYLHEECRVGCIVHRDMRPKNILLTHDFTAMVGDFGLAKLISKVDAAIETQVIGSLGFMAPEYEECGQVTSKTDVYSFGVVLLELISGRTAPPKGKISLIEWARPKLRHHRIHELVDRKVEESLDMYELNKMVKAASLCIKKDPLNRPGMSEVLRILEDDFNFLSIETLQENFPITRSIKPTYKSHSQENEEFRGQIVNASQH